jgi:hypothetical protein
MIDVTKLLPRLVQANPELAAKFAWSRAAGEGLSHNAVPVNLIGKTLVVSVADALWRKQLESMTGELLFRVNKLLGGKCIDEIVFQIAPADLSVTNSGPAKRQAKRTPSAPPTELLFAANSIADEDLRARFVRAATNLIDRRDSQRRRINNHANYRSRH